MTAPTGHLARIAVTNRPIGGLLTDPAGRHTAYGRTAYGSTQRLKENPTHDHHPQGATQADHEAALQRPHS
ncbi:MAG TPA: hypothetical protein PLX71_05380 [Phycicoccus sp.]|nr:hypothetical protein [Phycicoccus sp.]